MYIIYEDGSVIEFIQFHFKNLRSLSHIIDVLDLLPSYIYYDSDINVDLNERFLSQLKTLKKNTK